MLEGKMLCLDKILYLEDRGPVYLLMSEQASSDGYNFKVSFGRKRKLDCPRESYIASLNAEGYILEKIEFDDNNECNYLDVLKAGKIRYSIPKALPESYGRYRRIDLAVENTYWSHIYGFFGSNGYAITERHYVGDDCYSCYEIDFCRKPGSFCAGKHPIRYMSGFTAPARSVITKLLEEEVSVEEGESMKAFLKEAGIDGDADNLRFRFAEQENKA